MKRITITAILVAVIFAALFFRASQRSAIDVPRRGDIGPNTGALARKAEVPAAIGANIRGVRPEEGASPEDRKRSAEAEARSAQIKAGLKALKFGATIRTGTRLGSFLRGLGVAEQTVDEALGLWMDSQSAQTREEELAVDAKLRKLVGDETFEGMGQMEEAHFQEVRNGDLLGAFKNSYPAVSDGDLANIRENLDKVPSLSFFVETEMRFKPHTLEMFASFRAANEKAFDAAFKGSGLSSAVYQAFRKEFFAKDIDPWEEMLRRIAQKKAGLPPKI